MKRLLSLTSILIFLAACADSKPNEKVEIDPSAKAHETEAPTVVQKTEPAKSIGEQKSDTVIAEGAKPKQTSVEPAVKEVITHKSNEQSKVDSIKAAKAKTKKR
jgi:hypothetical protein